MRFWDSSALVPLLVQEAESARMSVFFEEDDELMVSAITAVEIESALWRRRHEGKITIGSLQSSTAAFAGISRHWFEVAVSPAVLDLARGIVSRHPMRSMDAIQLASATLASHAGTLIIPFITIDHRLAAAARAEGFPVLPAEFPRDNPR